MTSAAFGGALRLAVACSIGAPLPCVIIVSVNASSSQAGQPRRSIFDYVDPASAVNTVNVGNCSASAMRQLQATGTFSPGGSCCYVDVTLSIPGSSATVLQQQSSLAALVGVAMTSSGAQPADITVAFVGASDATPAGVISSAPPSSPVIVITAVAVGGGSCVLIILVALIFCACKRNGNVAAKEKGDDCDDGIAGGTNPLYDKQNVGGDSLRAIKISTASDLEALSPKRAPSGSAASTANKRREFKPSLSGSRGAGTWFNPMLKQQNGGAATQGSSVSDRSKSSKVSPGGVKNDSTGTGAVDAMSLQSNPMKMRRDQASKTTLIGVGADGAVESQSNPIVQRNRQ